MHRIVNINSPLTFLEQRLNYARIHTEREWTSFVENVPHWPGGLQSFSTSKQFRVGRYESCQGDHELRDALSEREHRVNHIKPNSSNILITNGALHALSLIVRLFSKSGAIALCQGSPYTCVDGLLRNAGFEVHYFQDAGGNSDSSSEILSLPKPDLIYINSPHNPTGAVLNEKFLTFLGQYTLANKIILVSDQVYDSFPLKQDSNPAALKYSSDWDYAISLNSFSKNYGMPGLRVGWITSSEKNIRQLTGMLEMDCVSVCGIAQDCALQALKRDNQDLVDAVFKRQKLMASLLSEFKGLEYSEPQGGLQYLVKMPVDDIEEFADFLMLKYGLVVATAANFANLYGPYLRLSYSYNENEIVKSLDLIKKGLNEFTKEAR